MAKWVFLNDGFIEEEKALLHFRDLSFQRGYGIFDFFRLFGNKPLFLDDHLNRFFFSAKEMHLAIPYDREEIKSVIFELVQKNNLPGAGIRLSLTGGYSEDGFNIAKPNLVIAQQAFSLPTGEQFNRGIKLISHPYQRQLSQVKTIDYLMAIWLQPLREQNGADDILYQHNGIITECPRANFFLVTAEGNLVTPSENVLKGITRKNLLMMAKDHYRVEERDISIAEIKNAREAFITSSTKQILPVRQLDDVVFEKRDVCNHLQQLFNTLLEKA